MEDFAGDGKIPLPGRRKISRCGGPGPGKNIRAGQSSSGAGAGDTCNFLRKILRVLCRYFEHHQRVHFEGCVAEPLQTITAILPGPRWSCLLLRVVLQDALSEVEKYPLLELRVFVDDTTVLMNGRNKELVEMAEKVLKKLKMEVEEKAFEVIDYGRRERRKDYGHHFMQVSGGEVPMMQQERRSCLGNEC